MCLTVGQLADTITKIEPDRQVMIERIRHWTRLGLLVPIGAGRKCRCDVRSMSAKKRKRQRKDPKLKNGDEEESFADRAIQAE